MAKFTILINVVDLDPLWIPVINVFYLTLTTKTQNIVRKVFSFSCLKTGETG